MSIVLARIDDRLIHGQVMTAWVSYAGGKEILIVDDKVAKDPFLSAVITGAAPKHLKATAVTIEQATKELLENKDNTEKKYILLAKGPETFETLINNGVEINEINLGGMGSKQGRNKLYKNVAASNDEKVVFKNLLDRGVNVYIQVVPNMEKVDLNKYL